MSVEEGHVTRAIEERVDSLNQTVIMSAAVAAAGWLAEGRTARVRFSPGDLTEYRITVVPPGPELMSYGQIVHAPEYLVTVEGFGRAYRWMGGPLSGSYVTEKWVPDNRHSGEVVARFLAYLAERL